MYIHIHGTHMVNHSRNMLAGMAFHVRRATHDTPDLESRITSVVMCVCTVDSAVFVYLLK